MKNVENGIENIEKDLKLKDGGMNPLILLMIGINLLLITNLASFRIYKFIMKFGHSLA